MIGIHRVQNRERGQAGLPEFVRLGGSAPNNVPRRRSGQTVGICRNRVDSAIRSQAGLDGVPGGGQRGVIVGMGGDLLDILHVADAAAAIHHENGPAVQPKLLDQGAVTGSE